MSNESSHASMICPYCGHYQPQRHQCAACNGLMDPLSQKATQIDMGPWFIRDAKQPYRPGCSYEILQRLAKTGRIDAGTILRGPTTHQYWTVARLVPGISHLVGHCYRCSTPAQPTDTRCSKCQAVFSTIPLLAQRNELGLRFPTSESADQARQQVANERPPLPPYPCSSSSATSASSASVPPAASAPSPSVPLIVAAPISPATDATTPLHLPSLGADLLRDIAPPTRPPSIPAPLSSTPSAAQPSHLLSASLTTNPSDPQTIAAAIASGLHKLPSAPSPCEPTASPNPTAPLPHATTSSKWTIILIVLLNVLLLAIVVAVVMMVKG